MVGHGGSSAGSYLADPTSPIPSHCASIVVTSTLRVNTHPFSRVLTAPIILCVVQAQLQTDKQKIKIYSPNEYIYKLSPFLCIQIQNCVCYGNPVSWHDVTVIIIGDIAGIDGNPTESHVISRTCTKGYYHDLFPLHNNYSQILVAVL